MLVSLVGAGPGDPGLFTLKGKRALENADVVIYDALANDQLLSFMRPDAEKIYVGKIADQHALPQADINKLLVSKAREGNGKRVVRLKGGDPFIFGRGGEEVEFLAGHEIPFEIIPGISSAIAVPAYAGISLTHRGYTSSLTILTGHENPEKGKSSHNWEALVKSNSTLVFVMGMRNLKYIVNNLVHAGMDGKMPAAVIYKGTTPFQKSVFAPLHDLEKAVEKAGLTNPAIIVIGKVNELAPAFAWYENKPLLRRRIVVTRATEQASDLSAALENLGARVIQCPAIRIKPVSDYAILEEALTHLSEYQWIIFTSANGVKFFWKKLWGNGLDGRALANCRLAAIGPGTARALEQKGIIPDLLPQKYIAEEVVAALLNFTGGNLSGRKILVPRAAKARMALVDLLAQAGAVVDVAPVYETVPDGASTEEVKKLLAEKKVDCITFASSSTVENFLDQVPAETLLLQSNAKLAAIGPITANALERNGLKYDIMPENYSIPDLVDAISGYFGKRES